MSQPTPAPLTPHHGPENAVPWPTPPIPGTELITFWGTGSATTEPFTLPGDASVRIAIETGPLVLRVLNPDGTDGTDGATVAPIPNAGLALAAIPQGGTYTLAVETTGNWGISIVFMTRG
jgi:hypothetical protein